MNRWMAPLLAALVLGLAMPASAQVAFVAGSTGGTSLSTTVNSGNFTVGSESNKVLVAIVTWATPVGSDVSGCRWAPAGPNEAMSMLPGGSTTVGTRTAEVWLLVNPSAATGSVECTFTDATVGTQAVTAALFSGANQTTPLADYNTATSTSATAMSVTISNTTANDMVMDAFLHTGGGGSTVGANQTRIGSEATPASVHSGSYQDGADGGAMTWTMGSAGFYLQVGVRVVAAAGGGSAPAALSLLGVGR